MIMQIPSNIPISFFITELVMGFMISLLVFLFGVSFIKSYVRRKEWDDADFQVDLTLIWFVLNLVIDFLFLFFLGAGGSLPIISDVLRVILGIGIFIVIINVFYNRTFKESLILAVFFQVIVYAMVILLQMFIDVIRFMVTSTDTDVFGAGVTYLFICMLLFGINSFYINWGDKAQFMTNRNSLTIVSTIPSFFYLKDLLVLQGQYFTAGFFTHLIYGLLIL